MIISVCNDDHDVARIGRHSARSEPNTFGRFYDVGQVPPQLDDDEDLFIIGHGAHRDAGDRRNAVIGNRGAGITLNGLQLAKQLSGQAQGITGGANIFPDGYTGNVYIYACETGDFAPDGFSLVEVVTNELQSALRSDVVAYGQSGPVDTAILPAPNDPSWRSGFH